jgi:hypothetical protein
VIGLGSLTEDRTKGLIQPVHNEPDEKDETHRQVECCAEPRAWHDVGSLSGYPITASTEQPQMPGSEAECNDGQNKDHPVHDLDPSGRPLLKSPKYKTSPESIVPIVRAPHRDQQVIGDYKGLRDSLAELQTQSDPPDSRRPGLQSEGSRSATCGHCTQHIVSPRSDSSISMPNRPSPPQTRTTRFTHPRTPRSRAITITSRSAPDRHLYG